MNDRRQRLSGGRACRYDGKANTVEALREKVERGEALHLSGGAGRVKHSARSVRARRRSDLHADRQGLYRRIPQGAEAALALIQKHHITLAVLKAKSPSCGKGLIYDGSFTRTLKEGGGITAGR